MTTPTTPATEQPSTEAGRALSDRFWRKVDRRGPDECWEWLGQGNPEGYGHIRFDHQKREAHRVAYELMVGPIPDGLVIDHLCRVPSCVNPRHLEPVTERENILRGTGPTAINARKTHCPNGHEYTPENTRLYAGHRYCRSCVRAMSIKYRARRKAARVAA